MSIQVRGGNLLDDDAQALVNAINTVGVMGGGIAKAFKDRWPAMFDDYRLQCRLGTVGIGSMNVHFMTPQPADAEFGDLAARRRYLINFPTKQHWRDPSHIEYIQTGLPDLIAVCRNLEITSIAIPKLGCGLGGLDWNNVRPLIEDAFQALPDVDVRLYQ